MCTTKQIATGLTPDQRLTVLTQLLAILADDANDRMASSSDTVEACHNVLDNMGIRLEGVPDVGIDDFDDFDGRPRRTHAMSFVSQALMASV